VLYYPQEVRGMRFLGYVGGALCWLGLIWAIFFLGLGLTVMAIGAIIMLLVYWFTFDEI